MLKQHDFFFNRVFSDHSIGHDGLRLADAVGAVDGLVLDGGIPPGVVEQDVACGGEIEAAAAGFEAQKEHAGLVILLEL